MAATTIKHLSTNCNCQYTLSVTSGKISEIKDSCNNTPSIHEIIEEDENDSGCSNQNLNESMRNEQTRSIVEEDKDEDEYANESFCSEDSCSESDSRDSQVLFNDEPPAHNKMTLKSLEPNDMRNKEVSNYNRNSNDSNAYVTVNDKFYKEEKGFPAGRARSRRKNMSFTDDEVHKIERENELLLRRIMAQHKTHDKAKEEASSFKTCSSAVNRRKLQKKIEGDNMRLLRRIQQVKPRVLPHSTTPGYRKTLI